MQLHDLQIELLFGHLFEKPLTGEEVVVFMDNLVEAVGVELTEQDGGDLLAYKYGRRQDAGIEQLEDKF